MSKDSNELAEARLFLTTVAQHLDLDPKTVQDAMPFLLGMTKNVAHKAIRPAAPLTAFLVGLATAQASDSNTSIDIEVVRAQIAKAETAIEEWNSEQD